MSTSSSRTVTSASSRSPATTSSTSLIDSGKMTVSLSGRIGRVGGSSWPSSSAWRCSSALTTTWYSGSLMPAPAPAKPAPPLLGELRRAYARSRPLRLDREDDLEHPALVRRVRVRRVDLDRQLEPPLKGAVFDFQGLVARAGQRRALSRAGDRQGAAGRDDLDRRGVDSRQLDEDVERGRVVHEVAVALGPEPPVHSGEPRHLPEVGEEFLDLSPQIVDVSLARRHTLPPYPLWVTVKAWHVYCGSRSALWASSCTRGSAGFGTPHGRSDARRVGAAREPGRRAPRACRRHRRNANAFLAPPKRTLDGAGLHSCCGYEEPMRLIVAVTGTLTVLFLLLPVHP